MTSKELTSGILRAVAYIIGTVALLWFLQQTSTIIVYLLIAAVISLIGVPLVEFLDHKLKIPNTLAVILTILIFILIFMTLIGMFVPLIMEQGQNLSLLDTDKLKENIQVLSTHLNDYLLTRSINLKDELSNMNVFSEFKQIPGLLNGLISGAGSFAAGLFSVLFISFFFMKDKNLLSTAVITMSPKGKEDKFSHSLKSIKHLLSRYFIGLILQITALFIMYTIVLLIVGVHNALVIAFLCALLNLIPYIGPLIAGVLIVFLTMSNFLGMDFSSVILPKSLWVLAGYCIAQLVDNTVSQPLIFSKSVNSHPLEIFLVILIGGSVFGIAGMVVAIPTYTAIKVILKEFLSDNKIVQSLTRKI